MKDFLNRTQVEIFALVYGLYFSFSSEDIFLKYLAPIILKTDTNPQMPFFIGLISFLVFLGSLFALVDIIKMIIKTHNLNLYNPRRFKNYFFKVLITLIFALFSADILSRILLK